MKTKLYRGFLGLVVGAALFCDGGVAHAASLSGAQVQSVVSLLQSFGADPYAVAQVQTALLGQGGGAYATCPALSYNLYYGLSDAQTNGQVSQLQRFFAIPQTGYFDAATYQATVSFQTQQAVYPISGGVGPLTRTAITRVCNASWYGNYGYVSATVVISAPLADQQYLRGSFMPIRWSVSSGVPVGATLALELYTASGARVGTIALPAASAGSYTWYIPYAQDVCTMQYPNGLCGVSIPPGRYYLQLTASANGFDQNATRYASARSGLFSVE